MQLRRLVMIGLLVTGLAACSRPADPADKAPARDAGALVPSRGDAAVDLSGRISAQDMARIARRLADFKAAKGVDIGVLVVESTGDVAMPDYVRQVAGAWKLGRPNIGDGVMIVAALADGVAQIEVGCGLETTIDPATIAGLIGEEMAPSFDRRDYAGGIGATIDRLMALAAKADLPEPGAPRPATPIWAGEPVSPGCQL